MGNPADNSSENKKIEDFIKDWQSKQGGGLKESETNFTNIGDKISEAFASNFDVASIAGQITALDDAAVNVIKQFGVGREVITDIKQSFADAYESVALIGGGWSDITSIQETAAKSLNRNLILTQDSYKDLLSTSKATGIETSTLIPAFKNIGVSVYQVSGEMQKVVDEAHKIGVSVSAVAGDVASNLHLMNKYNFQGGVQGLAKMAAQAANMRITVGEIGATMDKAFEPDSAIEMASALQRLGVTQSDLLDPLRLMDLAQNDPTELMNQMSQMSQQFVRMKEDGKFEILPGAKRQLMEVEKAMGLGAGTLSKMALSSAELDKKMSSIRFPDIPEEQKKFIANMSEMNKEGTGFVVRFTDEKGEAQEKLTTELDENTIKYLMEREDKQPKTMEEISKSQLNELETINSTLHSIQDRTGRSIASSKKTTTVLNEGKKITGGVGDAFDVENLKSKNIRKEFDSQADNLKLALSKLASGDSKGALDVLSTAAADLGTHLQTALTQVKDKGVVLGKEIGGDLKGQFPTDDKPPENKEIKLNDFIIKTHPQDSLVLAGGTKLGEKSDVNQKTTNDINLNITINSDSKVNKEELMTVFRSTDFLQQLNKNLKSVNTNYNLS